MKTPLVPVTVIIEAPVFSGYNAPIVWASKSNPKYFVVNSPSGGINVPVTSIGPSDSAFMAETGSLMAVR